MSDRSQLFKKIQAWGQDIGFSQIGVSSIDLSLAEKPLLDWLQKGFHGDMHYMQRHGLMRARPHELVPGTVSVITARMNYLNSTESKPTPNLTKAPHPVLTSQPVHFSDKLHAHTRVHNDQHHWVDQEWAQINAPEQAYVSLYARGRDYHKTVKQRLERLVALIQSEVADVSHRVFCDSAPVMEVELALRSALGWRGKHTLLLNREAGSMFFLGEIFVNFDLPYSTTDPVSNEHCGSCSACIDICPTKAIVAPYLLDARRCISYLTIEHPGSIDIALRPLMGNRIYGCDDCQLICPWNKFAQKTSLPEFQSRDVITHQTLLQLWSWSEEDFLNHTQGSAIRRIGHERWLRNIAIALGNNLAQCFEPKEREDILKALSTRLEHPSDVIKEHVRWAIDQA